MVRAREHDMAIAMRQEWLGTAEQYDETIRRIGLQSQGPGPAGGLFHWVTVTDHGTVIATDVWESQEAAERFYAEQVGPAVQAVGVPAPEQPPEFFTVHSYNTAGASEAGQGSQPGRSMADPS
jgi:hypothetical protein